MSNSEKYITYKKHSKNTINYELFIMNNIENINILLSPFHGVKLYPIKNNNRVVNMIVEIPQGTQEKIEINKDKILNPLTYDIKDNKIRRIEYRAKYSKFNGYPFHYGAFPQTWENSTIKDKRTGYYGDNDPVDCFDISDISRNTGDVTTVKILGAIAMIDDNETDWKLVSINTKDPNAKCYNELIDLPYKIVEQIIDFLTNYKVLEGKKKNKFADKMLWNSQESYEILEELHEEWQNLINGTIDNHNIKLKIKEELQ